MPTSLRSLLVLLLAGGSALVVAACGGADAASSDTSVDALLNETFASENRVESARLELALDITPQGAAAEGPISVRLSGPFQSRGERRLPKFALDLAFEGGGQRVRAGATSTGEQGFVRFQGRDYVASDVLFRQLRAGYEEAQSDGRGGQGLAGLGIDPRAWLRDPVNAGEADVGGEATVKITGGVDVERMLADVEKALGQAGRLGLQGAGKLPERLTEAQKREITESVSDPRVEIYTGADDRILRRLLVTLAVRDADAEPARSAAVRLDLTLADLNQDQEIAAPADARPLEELLGGLGAFGGLGGAGSTGGRPRDREALERYTECVTRAGSDADEARRCADELTP